MSQPSTGFQTYPKPWFNSKDIPSRFKRIDSLESLDCSQTLEESSMEFSTSDKSVTFNCPDRFCRPIPMSPEVLIPKNFHAKDMLVDFDVDDESDSSSCSSIGDYTSDEASKGESTGSGGFASSRGHSPALHADNSTSVSPPPTNDQPSINPFENGFGFALGGPPASAKKAQKRIPDSPFKTISFPKIERRKPLSSLCRGSLSPSRARNKCESHDTPFLPTSQLPSRRQSHPVKIPSIFLDDDFETPKDSLPHDLKDVLGKKSDMILCLLQDIARDMAHHSKY